MEVGSAEGVETVYDPHDVMLDVAPSPLEENAREAVRTGNLVTWHFFNCRPNLIFSDCITKIMQIVRVDVALIPIKIKVGRAPMTHDLKEVVTNDLLLLPVLGNPPVGILNLMDVILSPPSNIRQ